MWGASPRRPVTFALIGAGFLALILWADSRAELATAVVVDRLETVDALIEPYWRPERRVTVRFEPKPGAALSFPWDPDRWVDGVETTIETDLARFDALGIGAAVGVRYVPLLPLLARLDDQSPFETSLARLTYWLRDAGLAPLAVYVVWLGIATRWGLWPRWADFGGRGWVLLLVNLSMLQLVPLSILGYRDLVPPSESPIRAAQAVVQQTRLVTTIGSTRTGRTQSASLDLPRAFERVLLRFVPDGWSQSVVAVDEITEGSLPGLREGTVVSVAYPFADPRAARVEGASRKHIWENRLAIHVGFAAVFLGIWTIGGVGAVILRLLAAVTRVR